jgi:drug/metabolite transporter (DMT)-like permease
VDQPVLATTAFGLASAIFWGAGDFSGGLATRRAGVYGVVLVSQVVGVVSLAVLAIARHEPWPPLSVLGWGSAAGLMGGAGIIALYRALAVGRMGIAAAVTALVAASLPVLFASFSQGLPSPVQIVGFGLGLGGVWFISRPEGPAGHPAGLGLALLSGIAFGGFLILVGQIHPPAVFWPLTAARTMSLFLVLAVARGAGRLRLPTRPLLPLAALAGFLDAGGNAFFVLATQAGRLDVASMLASLNPTATVVLAHLILRERVSRTQAVGIAAALVAIPLIVA